MNIIGNSCASSYIVRDLLHEQFNNPFVWCSVTEADILYVMQHFSDIHWDVFDVSLYKNRAFNGRNVQIVVDGKFTIKYPHYVLSNRELRVDGVNVFANNIIEWSTQKYMTRIERMRLADPPFFILGGTWEDQCISLSTLFSYRDAKNIYFLDNADIVHDNYKVAVNNFGNAFKKMGDFYRCNKDPSMVSTESLV